MDIAVAAEIGVVTGVVVMLVDVVDDMGMVDAVVVVDDGLVGRGTPNWIKPWVIASSMGLGGVGWIVLGMLLSR